jgi:hypothetical protein
MIVNVTLGSVMFVLADVGRVLMHSLLLVANRPPLPQTALTSPRCVHRYSAAL